MRKPCCYENRRGCSKQKEDEKLTNLGNGKSSYHLPQTAGQHHHCGGRRRVKYERKAKEVKVNVKAGSGNDNGNFGEDEEDLFIKLHALLGNRWSLIAGRLPGRTETQVRNYWYSHLKTKLITMGIDPNNHHPSLPPSQRPGPPQQVADTSGPPPPPPPPPTGCLGGPGNNLHHANSESSSSSSNDINVSDDAECSAA